MILTPPVNAIHLSIGSVPRQIGDKMEPYDFLVQFLNLTQPFEPCHRGRRGYFQSKIDPLLRLIGSFPCRCWTCGPCAAKLRWQYGMIYGHHLLECEQWFISKLIDRKSDTQRLRRDYARWVRVCDNILSDKPLRRRKNFVSEEVDLQIAVTNFGNWLRELRRPCVEKWSPVNACQQWKPLARKGDKWSFISPAKPLSPIMEIIEEFDLDAIPKIYHEKDWRMKVLIPTEWSEDSIDQFDQSVSQ